MIILIVSFCFLLLGVAWLSVSSKKNDFIISGLLIGISIVGFGVVYFSTQALEPRYEITSNQKIKEYWLIEKGTDEDGNPIKLVDIKGPNVELVLGFDEVAIDDPSSSDQLYLVQRKNVTGRNLAQLYFPGDYVDWYITDNPNGVLTEK